MTQPLKPAISSYSFKYLNANTRVFPIMVTHKSSMRSIAPSGSGSELLLPKPARKLEGSQKRKTPSPARKPEGSLAHAYTHFQEGFIYTVPLERKMDAADNYYVTKQNKQAGNGIKTMKGPVVEVINAVVAFTCPDIALAYCNNLSVVVEGMSPACVPVEIELADLKHYSTILRLPLITVVNAFCPIGVDSTPVLFDYQRDAAAAEGARGGETYELYYYYKPLDVVGIPVGCW